MTQDFQKMNPDVKQKWLKALRSGEYSQGRRSLRSYDDSFCCLGVLCDLYAKEFNTDWFRYGDYFEFHGYSVLLPEAVQSWSGVSSELGSFERGSLANLNDLGMTFEEIADMIEKHF